MANNVIVQMITIECDLLARNTVQARDARAIIAAFEDFVSPARNGDQFSNAAAAPCGGCWPCLPYHEHPTPHVFSEIFLHNNTPACMLTTTEHAAFTCAHDEEGEE